MVTSVCETGKENVSDVFYHGIEKGKSKLGMTVGSPNSSVLLMETYLPNISTCVKDTSKLSCPLVNPTPPPFF